MPDPVRVVEPPSLPGSGLPAAIPSVHTSDPVPELARPSIERPRAAAPVDFAETTRQSYQAASQKRKASEKEMQKLFDTIRFDGCRCTIDEKKGQCRLESVETGKAVAWIETTRTCAADCRRWYLYEGQRKYCATPRFLQEKKREFRKKQAEYGEVVRREKETFEAARDLNDGLSPPEAATIWTAPK